MLSTWSVEIWEGPRLKRPASQRSGAPMTEDEPKVERVDQVEVPAGQRILIGRDPAAVDSDHDDDRTTIVRLGNSDPNLSRVAAVVDHLAGREDRWMLDCSNAWGMEVARWPSTARTMLAHGHWSALNDRHTAVLIRTPDFVRWITLERKGGDEAAEPSRLVGGKLDEIRSQLAQALTSVPPTEFPSDFKDPRFTKKQGTAFLEVYDEFLRWPPMLNPVVPPRSNVARRTPEKIMLIQSWAMNHGFVPAGGAGPWAFSPHLPQFLADNGVVSFGEWAQHRQPFGPAGRSPGPRPA